jgi:hypothetical protein
MKRKVLSVTLLVLCLALSACAITGGAKSKVVSSYELAGITLKAGYDIAKPACDQGLLKPEDCAQIKGLYMAARATYVLAGECLILAIETDDLLKRQASLDDYQKLAVMYTDATTKLINTLVELKLIEGSKP